MPRKAVKSPNEIFEALKDLYFINDKCRVLHLGHPVWEEASNKLNDAMSKKYIYLYLSQNRNGVLNMLLNHYGVDSGKDNIEETSLTTVCSNSYESNWSVQSNNSLPSLRSTIHLSDDIWNKIAPVEKLYKNRIYKVLKQSWTDVIAAEIWRNLKLPCGFAFKKAQINENMGEIYLKICGKCSECNTVINAYAIDKPTVDGIDLYISTKNTTGVNHIKKRQLKSTRRVNVVKEISASSVYAWRREKANELMSFGDVEPPHLYNEQVLRKAKQLEKDKKLGLINVVDPISSIVSLKYTSEFSGFIKDIGTDKFFVMYWSAEQIFLYKMFNKEQSNGATISIDATGSLIKSIIRPDGSSNVIFLYQIVASFRGKILPVCQMVSERHDTNMLCFWLREWLRTPVPYPSKVVVDYSLALLNAISLAFSDINLCNYIENCMEYLENKNNYQKPKCILRVDIAHMIKLVCQWKCYDGKHRRVKDFYVRCFGLLTKCTNVDYFREIFCNILIVSLSESEEMFLNKESKCLVAQQKLIKLIKNDTTLYDTSDNQNFADEGVLDDLDTICYTKMKNFLKKITSECIPINNGEKPNPYWCPMFATNLLRIGKHFPLWTAVMSESVASSACSEEYFRELKQLLFKDNKCMRADKFVVVHIRSLTGAVKILQAINIHAYDDKLTSIEHIGKTNKVNVSYSIPITSDSTRDTSNTKNSEIAIKKRKHHNISFVLNDFNHIASDCINNIDDTRTNSSYLNSEENWKGKNKNCKNRGTYLSVCPNITNIHLKPKLDRVPILKNGNTLTPIILSKTPIMIFNTCAFDAIAQTLLVAYYDWTDFHDYVENAQNDMFGFIKELSKYGACTKVYKERARILSTFINPINGTMDCTYNISNLVAKHLLKNEFSCSINIRCKDCNHTKNNIFEVLDINVEPFYIKNMQPLQHCINKKYTPNHTHCIGCHGENVEYSVILGQLLFIDIECLQWTDLAENLNTLNWKGTFTLDQIPIDMEFHSSMYQLLAVIEYQGTPSSKNVGHYIPYIRRLSGRWEIHNDLCREKNAILASQRILQQQKRFSLIVYVKTKS